MLLPTMPSLKVSIRIKHKKKLMLLLMFRLSSLVHKLLMLMFMLTLASQVRTSLKNEVVNATNSTNACR